MADDFNEIILSVKVDDSPKSVGDINKQIDALSLKLKPLKVKLDINDGQLDEITKKLQAAFQQLQSVGGQTTNVFKGVANATGTAFSNVGGQVKAVTDNLKKSIRELEDTTDRVLKFGIHKKSVDGALKVVSESQESIKNGITTRIVKEPGKAGNTLSEDVINNSGRQKLKRQIQDLKDAAKEQVAAVKEEGKNRKELEKALEKEYDIRAKLALIQQKEREKQQKHDLKMIDAEKARIRSLGDRTGSFTNFGGSIAETRQNIEQQLREKYGANAKIGIDTIFQGKNKDKEVFNFTAQIERAKGLVDVYKGSVDKATESIYEHGKGIRDSLGRNLGMIDRLKVALQNVPVWIAAMTLFYGSLRSVQSGARQIVELDTAMVSLRKVTDETKDTYKSFAIEATGIARDLKTTSAEVIKATAEFARLGYNINEAKIMAKEALLYSSVGDVNAETASKDMVSIIKGFGLQLDAEGKNIRKVVDSLNEVGNNYAVTVEGLGNALRRSSASLSEAGNNYNEAIALVVGANSTVQDPEVVG